jgi:hypothetical protein
LDIGSLGWTSCSAIGPVPWCMCQLYIKLGPRHKRVPPPNLV